MIEQLFEVATEFKFDAGQAILSTNTLQGAVDDLSKSATGAMGSLNYLAGGLVAHLGFGSGGLLSVLSKAVSVSEEFNVQALNFANNIGSNMNVLSGTIDNFNDRLATSKMLMENIQKTAIGSGLNTGDLAAITQKISSPLAQRGKLGTNYENGISMAKNLMLSSSAVGMNPNVAAESLSRALTDKMALHGALFARLANTQAFKSMHVMTQGQLQNMNTDSKINLLSKALEQLGGDSDFVRFRLNQIGVQFTMLKDQIEMALKPIGDAIVKPIRILLQRANAYLQAHGREIGENLGKLIGNIFDDPSKLFVNLMQLKSFGSDFKKALHLTELVQLFMFLRWGLAKIGITLGGGLIRRGFILFFDALTTLGGWFIRLGIFGRIFSFLASAIGAVLEVLAPLLFFFQIISRARAIAKLADIENMLTLTPRLSALMVTLKTAFENIMLPITMAIDFFAKLLAPLFETSTVVSFLLPMFELLGEFATDAGNAMIILLAALSGVVSVVMGFVYDLMNAQNPLKNLTKNLNDGVNEFLKAHPMAGGQGSTPSSKSVVYNNNHIEARFDMREQLEPDRIAFAVTTHLKKLAINATQPRNGSISGAYAGNQLVSP